MITWYFIITSMALGVWTGLVLPFYLFKEKLSIEIVNSIIKRKVVPVIYGLIIIWPITLVAGLLYLFFKNIVLSVFYK